MKQYILTGHAVDDASQTVTATFIVRGNEPPKNLVITPDVAEPAGGYNPGTVVTYTLAAEDDGVITYTLDQTVGGVTTPLTPVAGAPNKFQFTVPA